MFPAGGHVGLDPDLLDTIVKRVHPRTIVTKLTGADANDNLPSITINY